MNEIEFDKMLEEGGAFTDKGLRAGMDEILGMTKEDYEN